MPNDVTTTVVPAPAAPAAAPAEPSTFSREYVSELRHENAGQRKARQEAEAKAIAAEESVKKVTTESELKIAEAKKTADERIIRAELKASAISAGMVDLDGIKLADLSTVKINENGEVEGAEALMESLKKAKPYLFGEVKSSSNPAAKSPPAADQKFKSVADLTPEQYIAARAEIRRGNVPKFTA